MLARDGEAHYYEMMEQKTEEQAQREYRQRLKAERLLLQKQTDDASIKAAQSRIAERALSSEASWQSQALCSAEEVDPEIFDVLPKDKPAIDRAKRFCGACAVQSYCLDAALDANPPEVELVWGGTTPDERRAIRRSRNRYNSSRRS